MGCRLRRAMATGRRAIRGLDEALAAAIGALAAEQRADGEIPVTMRRRGEPAEGRPDRTLFATALAVPFLDFLAPPSETRIAAAARGFLRRERGRRDLARFWPRTHPRGASLPADLDDTAAMALALGALRPVRLRRLLLAQRDAWGRFHTWLLPRSPGVLARHPELSAAVPLLARRHPFWTRTEAARDDVDAGANAHAVAWLGDCPETASAASWLAELAAAGTEEEADRWHRLWGVRWLVARAAATVASLAPAAAALTDRIAVEADGLARAGEAADVALALAAGVVLGVPAGARAPLAERLLAEQNGEGRWPRAALWYGGARRTVDWGSAALTTALAAGALAAERQRRALSD